MIDIKTKEEITIMREGGKKLWSVLRKLLLESTVGVSLQTLEDHAQNYIKEEGAVPSFSTVKGYQWATCLCINDEVVHGIPSPYILQEGDVLTIDIGLIYKGFHTDTAWTKIIQNQKAKLKNQKLEHIPCLAGRQAGIKEVPIPGMESTSFEEKQRFLKIGEETLKKAISVAKAGNRVGNISEVIEQSITDAGYSVVRSLTGHGVGKTLHEEPMIPEYLDKPLERTPLLTPGMTIAIEVIYAQGKGAIVYSRDDGWTLASKDESLTAVFEQTIAIAEEKTFVLTGS